MAAAAAAMSWDPGRYLQYEDARLRPALELLARVPLAAPALVADPVAAPAT
jgi:trans-aconitate 2-methyltransferase